MKSIRLLSLLLALLLGASAIGCGDSTAKPGGDTTPADTTPQDTVPEPEYDFSGIDFGGKTLSILNSTTHWGCYTTMDLEQENGDILDDAVYKRNRFAEETFHMTLDIVEESMDSSYNTIYTSTMAGEAPYHIVYLRADKVTGGIADGCYADLSAVSSLQLEEDWWDQDITTSGAYGEDRCIFFAGNYLSLFGFDMTMLTFFNESMMEDLGLDKPYDLVREGKWTLDKLGEYLKLGANLNGADSFALTDTGPQTYGLTTWGSGAGSLIYGCGERYTAIDKDGMPYVYAGNERFFDVVAKIASLTAREGDFLISTGTTGQPTHYAVMLRNGRTLFTLAELKESHKYRDLELTFGVLPLPKYDENQESYYSNVSVGQTVMLMPVTVSDREEAGKVIDALVYLSYRDVLPAYYDVTVSQKGLRNDDSIEMLDIVRQSRIFDPGDTYGWTANLRIGINDQLKLGNSDISSVFAAQLPAAEAAIEKALEQLES